MNSAGRVNVSGAEVLLTADLAEGLRGQVAYTYTR